MFQSLLSEGTLDITEALDDLKEAVQGGEDPGGIVEAMDELRDIIAGHRRAPEFRT